MANATVELADEGSVVLDVSDNPALATEGVEPSHSTESDPVVVVAEPKAGVKKSSVEQTSQDEAREVLAEAVKKAEDARKAAEATALAERRKAEEATKLAQQKAHEAQTYREQVEDRELAIITSGIENAKRELETAQQDMERALEAGEFSKATTAQVKVSKAAAALDRLEDAKFSYEANARNRAEAPVEPLAAPTQVNAFEQYVSGFAPIAQAWLRNHPECAPAHVGGDSVKNAAMMEGHYAALRQRVPEGSPEYFRVIEEHAGYRTPTVPVEGGIATPVVKPKPKVQPSAPVSREPLSAAGGVPKTTRSVTLTPEQQEAAKVSFPNLTVQQAFAQYARNLIELEAEGKMGRKTH
jgi:hypothetical protein